jgi:urease accessory protein
MHTLLQLARGATLEYLPDHVIPHAGSILRQSLRIEMDEGSRGIFLDAFSSGRVALNEHWRFLEFDSRTELTLRGKPIYVSRTKIIRPTGGTATPGSAAPSISAVARPFLEELSISRGAELQLRHSDSSTVGALASGSNPAMLGRMSDYSYSASLLIIADEFPDWRPVIAALRAELESLPGVIGGISLLTEAGCSIRYLAKSAIDLQEATRRFWTVARRQVLGLHPLDLRKY